MIIFPFLREQGLSFLQKISRWWTRCHHHSQGRSERHLRAPPSNPSVNNCLPCPTKSPVISCFLLSHQQALQALSATLRWRTLIKEPLWDTSSVDWVDVKNEERQSQKFPCFLTKSGCLRLWHCQLSGCTYNETGKAFCLMRWTPFYESSVSSTDENSRMDDLKTGAMELPD